MNPYAVLGCTMQSTDAEIREAYLSRVRAFSPDSAPDQFRIVQEAYGRIRTAEGRAREVTAVADPAGSLSDAVEGYCTVSEVMTRPPQIGSLRRGILRSL